MIKKIIIYLCLIIGCTCNANTINNNLNKMNLYDKTQIKKEMFSNDCVRKLNTPEFKNLINQHKKDSRYPENYYAAQGGYTYYKNNYLTSKYTSKMDLMYEYSVQEQNNMRIIYYYSILGNLKNVDFLYGSYPNYPYYARKYSKQGKLISVTYYADSNTIFTFEQD